MVPQHGPDGRTFIERMTEVLLSRNLTDAILVRRRRFRWSNPYQVHREAVR